MNFDEWQKTARILNPTKESPSLKIVYDCHNQITIYGDDDGSLTYNINIGGESLPWATREAAEKALWDLVAKYYAGVNKIKWRFFDYNTGELRDPTGPDFSLDPHELHEGAENWDDVFFAGMQIDSDILDGHSIIELDESQEKYLVWQMHGDLPMHEYTRKNAIDTAKSYQDSQPKKSVVIIDVRRGEIVETLLWKTELYVCDNTEWLREHLDLSVRDESFEEQITEFYCTKLIEELEERGFYAHTKHLFSGCHEWNGAQLAKYKSGAIMSFDNIGEFELKSIDEAEDLVCNKTDKLIEEHRRILDQEDALDPVGRVVIDGKFID